MDLNYSAISDLCNNNSIEEKGYIFVLDAAGNIVYHPKQQLMYGGLKTENIDAIMGSAGNIFVPLTRVGTVSFIRCPNPRGQAGRWWRRLYTSELLKNKPTGADVVSACGIDPAPCP